MKKRVFLLEDDVSLGTTLKERLDLAGYETKWCQTVQDSLLAYRTFSPDLVILDVSLPDGSGFDVAKAIKASSDVPVVFLTAMNTAEDRLVGYELGAAEYIPKPFHLKELFIRIDHVLETHSKPNFLQCGPRKINMTSQSVTDSNGAISYFTARDFSVLKLLIDSAPAVVSRDDILNKIWGEEQFPTNRTIDNTIVRLRQALDDKDGLFIRSVRGVGYQWVAEGHK